MGALNRDPVELTYPMGAAARLTGLTPELLRSWERRYGVVDPLRTPGGTRRYRASDLERLRLVKAAVDAGHRVGRVAQMSADELRLCVPSPSELPAVGLEEILDALDRLDAAEAHRLLSTQLASLGPVRFARELAVPLVREVGERWAANRTGIAAEHLATSVLRALLGSSLQPTAVALAGPRVLFSTPSGEPHELGLQMAALTAMGAGANPIYLGVELPVEDIVDAAQRSGAAAVALSVVTVDPNAAAREIHAAREGLPPETRLWIGGSGASGIELRPGIERVESLDLLERLVASMRHAKAVALS